MKIAKNKAISDSNNDNEIKNQQEKYSECIKYIRKAIDALTSDAKTDEDAREALTNLSVILFDLKG